MKKILNVMFLSLKFILLLITFGLTLYIVLSMYQRINKNMIESISIFLPYLLILVIFLVNIFLKQKWITNNLFYNLVCCLVFATSIVICIRSIYDKNMLLNGIMGYGVNFNYFSDYLAFMKIMMYGLIIGNLFFMAHEREIIKDKPLKTEEVSEIAKKIEVEVL